MLSKKDAQKYLNKFHFIRKLNGFSRNWFKSNIKTCMYCRFQGDSRALIKAAASSLYYDDENDKIYEARATCTHDCVEFLRSPKKSQETR